VRLHQTGEVKLVRPENLEGIEEEPDEIEARRESQAAPQEQEPAELRAAPVAPAVPAAPPATAEQLEEPKPAWLRGWLDGLRGLGPGREVQLTGLAAAPQLNGERGSLQAFHSGRGRWAVRLHHSGEVKLVRPENLERIEEEPDEIAPGAGARPRRAGRRGPLPLRCKAHANPRWCTWACRRDAAWARAADAEGGGEL